MQATAMLGTACSWPKHRRLGQLFKPIGRRPAFGRSREEAARRETNIPSSAPALRSSCANRRAPFQKPPPVRRQLGWTVALAPLEARC